MDVIDFFSVSSDSNDIVPLDLPPAAFVLLILFVVGSFFCQPCVLYVYSFVFVTPIC